MTSNSPMLWRQIFGIKTSGIWISWRQTFGCYDVRYLWSHRSVYQRNNQAGLFNSLVALKAHALEDVDGRSWFIYIELLLRPIIIVKSAAWCHRQTDNLRTQKEADIKWFNMAWTWKCLYSSIYFAWDFLQVSRMTYISECVDIY